MTHPVLTALGLTDNESGTYLGSGQWSATKDAGVLEPVNPTTGEVLGRVQASSQADYEAIVERAQAVYKVWRTTPAPRRGEAIRLCADALRTHKDALGSLVALEMGKSKPEGDGEVQEMIDIGEFAVGLSRQLYGLTMHSERPGHRMYEQWHPIGIVGVISAFNFPVAVWAWNSFVAAICGDITIWKPSPKTPLSAIAAMKICNEALKKGGFPDIFFLFNDAGSELAQQFVDDKRIPLISFTGSTKVGRMVGERVAQRMGRSLLELGGNNAIIVDQTADLKLAIPAIAFGAVGTAGQRCTTTRRLFVHESIYDDVLGKLIAAYKQVEKKIGDPTDPANLMGPLNSKDGVDAYLDAVEKAKAAGGKIETGGAAIEGKGNFVLPTIVTGLTNDAADRAARDLRADPVRDEVQDHRRSHRHAERRAAGPVVVDLHHQPQGGRSVPGRVGFGLRHRQRQHRHLRRGDRRRLRRREGNRRWPGIGLGCVEGLYAPPDQHDQLLRRAAAGAGHQVRPLRTRSREWGSGIRKNRAAIVMCRLDLCQAGVGLMYGLARPFLFGLDAERAHSLTLDALEAAYRTGLNPLVSRKPQPLPTKAFGLTFPNPVGLAAGLDKNGAHIDALLSLGFGFIEIGTVTPKPQAGNPSRACSACRNIAR